MKSLCVLIAIFTVASLVSAYSDQLFPILHRHGRRAGHKHLHKKHVDLPAVKRQGQCQFPTNVGLVPVTPDQQNAGWAMSPNQPCVPDSYCPYACPPGNYPLYNVLTLKDKLWHNGTQLPLRILTP
jgi:hypothetical protein